MVFNTLTFAAFFACVLTIHSLPLPWTFRKVNLLLASYLFYSAWNPPFVVLPWISTVVDWYAAQGLVKSDWDVLLAKTGAPGIYYADYPQLSNFELPDWSHMSKASAERYTAELVRLLRQKYPQGGPW